MENTQKTPKTLKPEQMESGKWYVVDTFLIKFEKIEDERIYRYNSIDLESKVDYSKVRDGFICIDGDEKIRHATKEEVLKYFPDEVFEPIELRPEDLVSGEVYTYINIADEKSILKFNGKFNNEQVYYHVKLNERGVKKYDDWVSVKGKFYHATPEEKKLLLGEEEKTDWEAKYNELKSNYELSKNDIEIEKDLRNQWHNHYFKLKEEYNELKSKFDQLEPKGEKVYFYFDNDLERNLITSNLEDAVSNSKENQAIYEGYCIGKKKSVLVDE